jgi:hypothetical protein
MDRHDRPINDLDPQALSAMVRDVKALLGPVFDQLDARDRRAKRASLGRRRRGPRPALGG